MQCMKRRRDLLPRWLCGPALVFAACARAAVLPGDWQYEQPFDVSNPGLVKLSLPVQTLDRARPGLEDLRVCDDAGHELPYLIERPRPAGRLTQRAETFQVSLNPATTVISLETGLAQPLAAVTLETPAAEFIKSVQIAGSNDGKSWQTLAQGEPIFRQPGGANQLQLVLPEGRWRWLQLTVDDQRSQPIPFTGARIHAASAGPAPIEELLVSTAERHENPGETRLTLNLGAANLDLAAVRIETVEPLFTRQIIVAVPRIVEDSIREETVAQGTIYRVAIEGQPPSAKLSLPVESQVRSRELLLLIRNQDSPALPITAVRVERRPVYLILLARQSGPHHLLLGNNRCASPSYDLAALGGNLNRAALQPLNLSDPVINPGYRAPEVLPGVQGQGAALDVSAWRFRKAIKPASAGVQQIELDLEVLSHAERGFQDLRLLRAGNQVPYVLEHTSISRSLSPMVTGTNDFPEPKLSRWIIRLPQPALPVTRLRCAARTRLFQRDMALDEEVAGERGEKFRRQLGSAFWIQTPDRVNKEFFLPIVNQPDGDALFLETHNGDNPPIELEDFQLFYPATRVLFKANAGEELSLYYGNPQAASPRYDLSLVAGQLLSAHKTIATLGPEARLRKLSWAERQTPGKGGVVFWAILALVVVGLLLIISRLLPKTPESPK
jgi:hypothetical protein